MGFRVRSLELHYGTPPIVQMVRVWMTVLAWVWPGVSLAQESTGAAEATAPSKQLPMAPSRTLRFSVSEGTWMSLDVAPDGRVIVFDLLGDLYTLPIAGGAARRLTFGMAINRQPRYSPDGRQVVFVSDRNGRENVWIADRDGSNPRQLSDLRGFDAIGAVTSPVWSPDGRTIIVCQRLGATRAGPADDVRRNMWLVAAYDTETRRMRWVSDTVPLQARSVLGPSFDSHRGILYAAVNLDPLRLSHGGWRIGRIELKTGRFLPEMGDKVGRIGIRPVVSPDGRWLVYGSSSGSHIGLRVRDLTTDRERWLVSEALDDPSGLEQREPRDMAPGYAFTPDSKSLIAAYGGKIHRITIASGRAAVIPFTADVDRKLGPLTLWQSALGDTAVRTHGVLQAALSPDGDRVAFCALDRIWVMELPRRDGRLASPPRRLTRDSIGEFYPSWSPDGRWIAYTSWRDGEGGAIWRAEVSPGDAGATARPMRLTTDTALYFHTAVSLDGERVVAVRLDLPPDRSLFFPGRVSTQRQGGPSLVWLHIQGGTPRTIGSLPALPSARTLQDVARHVYFGNDRRRIYVGLTSWGWDGSSQQMGFSFKHADGTVYSHAEPRFLDGSISPNGRRALVSIGRMLYEVALPACREPHESRSDTLEIERAQLRPFGGGAMAARWWGTAIKPWVSWSRDGRRTAFAQGGVLYVGDVPPTGWTVFRRFEVPLTVKPDIPRGVIAFRGARLITMRGDEVMQHGDLVVKDNRIAAVGPLGHVTIPAGARVIDARGMTILPGYVDIHEHAARPWGVHPQKSWRSLLEMAYGVTAVRDPYSQEENDDFAYADRERTGDFLGPRMFSSGLAYVEPYPPIRTLGAARDAVRRNAEDFATETFKLYYDRDNTDRQARQLLAMAAREAHLNATVHINGLDHALASVIDGLTGVEHNPNIKIYDDVATLIARSGVTYTHTYLATFFGSAAYMTRRYGEPLDYPTINRLVPPSAREYVCAGCTGDVARAYAPLEFDNVLPIVSGAARIVAHGGRVGIGSHGNIVGIGFHYELWLHALGGMPNHEILRSATTVGATAIGHSKDFGSLEPGKLADLQVLNKNPLENIRNSTSIRYVMKNGRLYQAEDLTEIWPRQKPLPSIYLWDTKRSDSTSAAQGQRN